MKNMPTSEYYNRKTKCSVCRLNVHYNSEDKNTINCPRCKYPLQLVKKASIIQSILGNKNKSIVKWTIGVIFYILLMLIISKITDTNFIVLIFSPILIPLYCILYCFCACVVICIGLRGFLYLTPIGWIILIISHLASIDKKLDKLNSK